MGSAQTAYKIYEVRHRPVKESEFALHSKYCLYACPHCGFEACASLLKTTRRNPTVLWPSQRVQVTTYGMLLELMGFDCSDLELSVFTLKRTKEPTEDQKKQFLGKAVWVLIGEKTKELVSSLKGALAIHTFHYNPKEARDNIEPSVGYWLKQREPVPTRNPRKCKPCEFNDICPFSLV